MASYTKTLRIQAPPRKLYEAVSTFQGLKGWWRHNTVEKKRDLDRYADAYKRNLKHRILEKRKRLTHDLLLINAALDKLQSL
jgi:hypothetical protein